MDLEDIMLSEVSQTKKDKYCVFTYMWNLKTKQVNWYNKTEINLRYREQTVVQSLSHAPLFVTP